MTDTNNNDEASRQIDLKKSLEDLDTYGQIALKTIMTVSVGACAFTIAAMGTLFSSLHEKSPNLALKTLQVIDSPFDEFLKATISALICICLTYTACIVDYICEIIPNHNFAQFLSLVINLLMLSFGYAAFYFCIIGFTDFFHGFEKIQEILMSKN